MCLKGYLKISDPHKRFQASQGREGMANSAFRKDPFGSCVGCILEDGKAKGNGLTPRKK